MENEVFVIQGAEEVCRTLENDYDIENEKSYFLAKLCLFNAEIVSVEGHYEYDVLGAYKYGNERHERKIRFVSDSKSVLENIVSKIKSFETEKYGDTINAIMFVGYEGTEYYPGEAIESQPIFFCTEFEVSNDISDMPEYIRENEDYICCGFDAKIRLLE